MIESQAAARSKGSITEWLVEWIARELGLPPAEIETDKSLLNYSLSSVTAMMLVGDLEEWLGLTLPPTLVWDYPSIDAIADYLIEQLGTPVAGTPTSNGAVATWCPGRAAPAPLRQLPSTICPIRRCPPSSIN